MRRDSQRWLEACWRTACWSDAAVAQSLRGRARFWALRDACAEFFQIARPARLRTTSALPVAAWTSSPRAARPAAGAGIPAAQSVYLRPHRRRQSAPGVAGSPGCAADAAEGRRWTRSIYGLVREYGGSVSAEHGIGTEEEVARPCAQRGRNRADAHAEERARPAGTAQPRQGDLMAAWVDHGFKALEALLAMLLLAWSSWCSATWCCATPSTPASTCPRRCRATSSSG